MSAEDFGRAVLDKILKDTLFFETKESEEWCKILERFGYVELIPYDPEKHGTIDADPGQPVWIFTDKMREDTRA